MLPAVLLGAAAAVLLLPAAPQHRLRLLARRDVPRERVSARRLRQLACALLGLIVGVQVGAPVGLLVGLGVAVLGPLAMDRADTRAQRADDELTRQLPLALDLLGACLVGGSGITPALHSVGSGMAGLVGERFRRVASSLSLGTPPAEAFRELGATGAAAAAAAARSLCRASEGGAPVAAAVIAVAEESRRRARLEARKRARRAGNLATAPLTLCFLPAFLVLGIVPCFVGVAAPILSSF